MDRGGQVASQQHIREAEGAAGRTDAGLFRGRSLIPLVTFAVVRSGRVDAVSVDTGVTHTLVHIWERDRSGRPTDVKRHACTG